jgi:putative transposase
VIPSLSFFTFSLVNVRDEQSYPLQVTQTIKSAEEKAASKAKAEAKKAKKTGKPGRPKGSRNKAKQTVVLNPELVRIQMALHTLLETVRTTMHLKYVAMDGHFGNYPSAYMIRQACLHLISKLRSDAANVKGDHSRADTYGIRRIDRFAQRAATAVGQRRDDKRRVCVGYLFSI